MSTHTLSSGQVNISDKESESSIQLDECHGRRKQDPANRHRSCHATTMVYYIPNITPSFCDTINAGRHGANNIFQKENERLTMMDILISSGMHRCVYVLG